MVDGIRHLSNRDWGKFYHYLDIGQIGVGPPAKLEIKLGCFEVKKILSFLLFPCLVTNRKVFKKIISISSDKNSLYLYNFNKELLKCESR